MKRLLCSGLLGTLCLVGVTFSRGADPGLTPKLTYTKLDNLRKAGWKTDRPPYPYEAMHTHEQGTIYFEMTTDATGKIVQIKISKEVTHPVLDAQLAKWVPEHWHGPANAQAITSFTFVMH